MTSTQFRPTFQLPTSLCERDVVARVQNAIADQGFKGQFVGQHMQISIVEHDRHFWSPWLHLEVRDVEGDNQLFGRFSPHPTLWLAFVFAYLSIAFICFFASIIGLSQWLAHESAWAFVVIPLGGMLAVGLWVVSQVGQKLARQEMEQMQAIVLECLHD